VKSIQKSEYAMDRKNAEIQALKNEIEYIQYQFAIERRDRLMGEVVMYIIMFAVGVTVGWQLL
jgi:hypothetical protein